LHNIAESINFTATLQRRRKRDFCFEESTSYTGCGLYMGPAAYTLGCGLYMGCGLYIGLRLIHWAAAYLRGAAYTRGIRVLKVAGIDAEFDEEHDKAKNSARNLVFHVEKFIFKGILHQAKTAN
jgi:hypothetical protein